MEISSPSKDAYIALRRILREMEHNLEEGEAICISGMGPNCSEFFLQSISHVPPLISLIGDADDNRFEELVFSPGQISLRLFTAKRSGKREPIGFGTE